MKTALCFFALISAAGSACAASGDFAGSFSGQEQLTVSRCIDKVSTSQWQASFDVDGDTYTGKGTSTDGGKFEFKGNIDQDVAKGTVEGRSAEGNLWEGKTEATLSPEGELAMKIDGKVPTHNCDIAVRIKAKKVGT